MSRHERPVASPAPRDPASRDRKSEHIRLAMDARMQLSGHFFDAYRIEHNALPEIDYEQIEIATSFVGRSLSAPLLISCMTGGTETAARINRNLAVAAERCGIALGVGSQRRAFEDAATEESFRVRPHAPGVPILANLGAVQLNHGFGIAECRRAVEMIEADALVLHLNCLQEAIQPEGQCDFSGLLDKMAEIGEALHVPVVVKEVGCGISGKLGRRLLARGLRIVDCAGTGGTTWARIEAARASDVEIGELFADWGMPTPQAIEQLAAVPGLTVVGSGGIRHGVDAAKALALGADLVGMAFPFLEAAAESAARVAAKIDRTVRELKISMFCCGARTLQDLGKVHMERAVEWK